MVAQSSSTKVQFLFADLQGRFLLESSLSLSLSLSFRSPAPKLDQKMKSIRKSHRGIIQVALFLITICATSSLLSSSASASSIISDPDTPSVYEILPKFGLPSGLLPDNVASYTFADDGSFVVELPKPCYIHFDYLVYYEKRITGKLSYGSITKLHGIQVQRFFLWFDVDEIRVDLPPSNNIYFQVGLINKKLDVNQFKTIHSCSDNAFSSGGQFEKETRESLLGTPVDEVEMLLTE